MMPLSLPARVFGWVFMPRTMLAIRRARAEIVREEEILALSELWGLPEYTGERTWAV